MSSQSVSRVALLPWLCGGGLIVDFRVDQPGGTEWEAPSGILRCVAAIIAVMLSVAAPAPGRTLWKPALNARSVRANRRNQQAFSFVFLVINLHTLRYALGPLYLLLYAAAAAFAFTSFVGRRRYLRLIDGGRSVAAWCAVAVAAAIVTFITTSPTAAATGLTRFVFAVPVFLAIVAFTDSRSDLRSHLGVMVVFYTLGALTVPLQEVTGPIRWFADPTVRGGFDRYGSLLGAVSVVALGVGMIVPIISETALRGRWFYFLALCGSALISLSKAAILSVAFGGLVYLLFARQSLLGRSMTILGAVLCGVMAFAFNPSYQERFDVIAAEYGISLSGNEVVNFDVDTRASALDRLTKLPRENFAALEDFETPFVYVTGGGFGMGGQTLVSEADSRAPQGHNQYVELLTIFGPFLAAVLIGTTLRIAVRLWHNYQQTRDKLYRTFLLVMIFFMFGALFGGGTYFQPVAASMLWTSMFVAFAHSHVLMARDVVASPALRVGSAAMTWPTERRSAAEPRDDHPFNPPTGSPSGA